MKVTSPAHLNSLAERVIFRGVTSENLPKLAVLKPGKTFEDFKKAWETTYKNESYAGSAEQTVAMYARRLFYADVILESLVPDDGF